MQKIYVAAHKPYRLPEDSLYEMLQVGAAQHDAFCEVRDNTGKHISERNGTFCELTGMYWMRHNTAEDVVGLAHYRRHFAGKRSGGHDLWKRILTGEELTSLMSSAQIILPKKRHYVIETTLSHYAHAHRVEDLLETRRIIQEKCGEYLPAFDAVMDRRSGHRFNMFIMSRPLFEAYCDWLFPILFELEARIDIADYDAYNRRVFGFIGERLLDVWLEKNGHSYKELPVLELERPNWFVKGGRFVMRKIRGYARN